MGRFSAILGILLMCMTVMPVPATAQSGESIAIKGTVLDSGGLSVIGASVIVSGTTNGTITDMDGNFKLDAPMGSELVISCVGYATKTINVTSSVVKVVLEEDAELLSEVVVTALGIKREQKALSYNVQEVKGDQLTQVKDANFINALAGKVAGVTINASSAGTGGATRIVMRGTKSLEKDDNALYVIDGIPMFNVNGGNSAGGTMSDQPGSSSVADINPDDIETISVLTGPSAAALYGYNAANGVILITTKKGSEGRVKIAFNNSTSFSTPTMMPQFQDTYGNLEGSVTSWGKKLDSPSGYNPANFFNTGVNVMNGLTFSVGNEKSQTYASVSTTNATGTLPNNGYNRYNFSIRNTSKFAKNKLTLDVGAQYIIQNNKNMVGSGQYFNPLTSLYLFPRGESFADIQMFERYSESRNINVQYWPDAIFGTELNMQNPYWVMYRITNESDKRRYMLNGSLKWDITKWLNIIGRVRVDNSDMDSYSKRYASTTGLFTEGSNKGYYGHTKQNDRTIYADVIANISKTFVDDKLSINANIGASLNDQREDMMFTKGGLEQIPNFFHFGNIKKETEKKNETAWHDQVQSVFANFEAGWDHMLYLTLTGRNDWDSHLAFTSSAKKGFFYPSVGLSFVVSELFNSPVALPYLKVRASWARVASSPARYLTHMQYEYNEQTGNYSLPSVHYNPDLLPEITDSWEVGVNAKLWENRINADLTFYQSNTYNQTFYVDASASSGYSKNIVQTGNIQNRGIEAALGYSDSYASGRVKFSTSFTFTLNQNKIIRLANGYPNPDTGEAIVMDYYPKGVLGVSGGPTIRLSEGGSMGDIYINQRLRQSPNGYIWVSPKGEVEIENTEYRKVGSILPKFHMGWNTSLSYAGFDLNIQFAARFGGLVVSDTQAYLDRYGVSAATAKARDNGLTLADGRPVDAQKYYEKISTAIGTYYTYDATNIRLSELSLNYNLPKKWFREKVGISVGFTGRNLLMIYCKAPFDPESTSSVSSNFYQGVDFFQQPALRNLGFNIKINY